MTSRRHFALTVDRFMDGELSRLLEAVPSADHLVDDHQPLQSAYYLRHLVETVKRIWLTSQTDALALARMIDEDYDAARIWSKYVWQELNHDKLYLRDLEKHGWTLRRVASVPPFPSTLDMVGFITHEIRRTGSIAAVAYSVWVEWNSERASARVVRRAESLFSTDHVRGAKSHLGIDTHEDHLSLMLDLAFRLIRRSGDELGFFRILRQLTEYVGRYFGELEPLLQPASSRSTRR